jgi:short-subunit dehydrogenase
MRRQRRSKTTTSRCRNAQIDLASSTGVEEFYGVIQDAGRPVDAIALNAGVGAGGDFVRGTALEADLNVINLNVTSAVHLAKLVLKDMVQRGQGRVLFTSSIASTMPGTFNAVYNASKAFVQSFAHAIRAELKESGVTITALMPGATETNFFRRADMEDTKIGQSEKDDPADVAKTGFEALMAGEDHVVAGSIKNKVQATMAHVLPDTVTAEMHRKQAEPALNR